MEFNLLKKILIENLKNIIIFSFLTSLLFLIMYFLLPEKYLAEGTIYVYPVNLDNQKSEVSNELNYARNIIALSNSPEFKNILFKEGLSFSSFAPLIGVVGGIKLKEISPNILSLSLSDSNESEASKKYKKYYEQLSNFSQNLNRGNSRFQLDLLSENPIVSGVDKNIYLFFLVGFTSGFFVSSYFFYTRKK